MGGRAAFEARSFYAFFPPVVDTSGKQITVLATSGSAVVIDLTTVPGHQSNKNLDDSNDMWNPTPLGRHMFVQADTVDAYIAFGPTAASLSSLSPTAVSTVASNAVTQVAGGCIRIPVGFPVRMLMLNDFNTRDRTDQGTNSLARFMGIITAGSAGFIRIYQSGP